MSAARVSKKGAAWEQLRMWWGIWGIIIVIVGIAVGTWKSRSRWDTTQRYQFAIVADLDEESRECGGQRWKSVLQKGELLRGENGNFSVGWGAAIELVSTTSRKNRSMELSELVWFHDHSSGTKALMTMCDSTGIVFTVSPRDGALKQMFVLPDGDGKQEKPFKLEWATTKDSELWLGSIGKEWVAPDGSILHRNAEWVKIIKNTGEIATVDWGPVYAALRKATNTTYPGYLWHEAVHWVEEIRRWIFLPRKASKDVPYTVVDDEIQGTNLLIVANEDFSEITARTLGPLDKAYGFSTVRKLPGSEGLFAGLKVSELNSSTHTALTVFDLEGTIYVQDTHGIPHLHVSSLKFEGLEFL